MIAPKPIPTASNSPSSRRNWGVAAGGDAAGGSGIIWPLSQGRSYPDVGSAVAIRETHLMSAGRAMWFLAEIDMELFVEAEAALCGIAIDLQHVGALLGDLRVELIVPHA